MAVIVAFITELHKAEWISRKDKFISHNFGSWKSKLKCWKFQCLVRLELCFQTGSLNVVSHRAEGPRGVGEWTPSHLNLQRNSLFTISGLCMVGCLNQMHHGKGHVR